MGTGHQTSLHVCHYHGSQKQDHVLKFAWFEENSRLKKRTKFHLSTLPSSWDIRILSPILESPSYNAGSVGVEGLIKSQVLLEVFLKLCANPKVVGSIPTKSGHFFAPAGIWTQDPWDFGLWLNLTFGIKQFITVIGQVLICRVLTFLNHVVSNLLVGEQQVVITSKTFKWNPKMIRLSPLENKVVQSFLLRSFFPENGGASLQGWRKYWSEYLTLPLFPFLRPIILWLICKLNENEHSFYRL